MTGILLEETWRRLLKNRGAVIGMCFLVLLVVVAVASGFIYDYDTDIIQLNMAEALKPPSAEHWFGTDSLGRDIFARVLYGARYSLIIGVGSVTIGLLIGVTLGAIAGFYGGIVDQVIMRCVDVFYSIPNIMIAVVVVALLGTSTINLLIALCFTCATSFCRIARGGYDHPRPGVCRIRLRHGPAHLKNYPQAYHPELPVTHHRAGYPADRHDDYRGVLAVLPRHRRTVARAGVGRDALRGAPAHPRRGIYLRHPGLCHHANRVGAERARRRPARRARPEDEKVRGEHDG